MPARPPSANKRPDVLLTLSPDHPEPRKLRRAVLALAAGEVIAYPTDTVYALGCDLLNKKAIDRLYAMKRLDHRHPLSFICPDLAEIARYAIVEKHHYRMLRRLLPGPYTCILEATREVPKLVRSKKKTVGIRVPGLELPRSLARELGHPILTTSANAPDREPFVDPREIDAAFPGLGLVLDGDTGGTMTTTIIDLTKTPFEIVREGAGPTDDLVA